MTTGSAFDALFQPGGDLLWGLIERIENRSWRVDRIKTLPPPTAALVRLAFLKTRYDNGGLLYVFECDHPACGRAICDALALVGLRAGAKVLTRAFDLFPSQADYDDWDRRFATIARLRKKFDHLDRALGASVAAIEEAAAGYIRTHRQEFEHLRKRRPYHPLEDCYGEPG